MQLSSKIFFSEDPSMQDKGHILKPEKENSALLVVSPIFLWNCL